MIGNLLFYLKNLILKWDKTPKELRKFNCFKCSGSFTFPVTSKDYFCCNDCWADLGDEE